MVNPTTALGVSVEEITKLPYSVTLADTAVPAFIGYTELVPAGYNGPLKISSLLEYEQYFGKAKKENLQLRDVVTVTAPPVKFLMYYSLQMYFANGGGACYIISTGRYPLTGDVLLSSLSEGLNRIEAIKEPILIIVPDAVSLTSENDFYDICNQAVAKAEDESKNRFVILDTYHGNSAVSSDGDNTIKKFRNKISKTSHAAVYFPHVTTVLNYSFDDQSIITHTGLQDAEEASAVFYAGEIAALEELKNLAGNEISNGAANGFVLADLLSQAIAIADEVNQTADIKDALTDAINEAKAVLDAIHEGIIDDFIIPEDLDENAPVFSGEFDALKNAVLNAKDLVGNADGRTLKNLQLTDSLLYTQINEAVKSLKVVLPPSSAMAGVYGRIDSIRGVWKAPANVNLHYVIAPTERISEQEQAGLNIHDTGKSINAIRTFTGKGILVWGARTLDGKDKKEDGKDNEWKYVHVRLYYNMINQSIREALGKFIHEPNSPYTWVRTETMLENFLNQQWMDGALAGNTPKEAYEVQVYGSTDPVTDQTTNTMNVQIKIALVRPAEFIVLNFSHHLQRS